MPTDQHISLNFLPLAQQEFTFTVYRAPYSEQPRGLHPSWHRHELPDDAAGPAERQDCWVSLTPESSFSPFICSARTNRSLTCRFLFDLLRRSAGTPLASRQDCHSEGFHRRIVFVLKTFPQGDQCVWLSPHFLWSREILGFLGDFWFRRRPDQPFEPRGASPKSITRFPLRENRNLPLTDFYN